MLRVTKWVKFISSFTRAMMQAHMHTPGMADISSAAFVFDEDLACPLEIEDLSDTEGTCIYFTTVENDRVSICRAVVETGKCLSCFRRYFR